MTAHTRRPRWLSFPAPGLLLGVLASSGPGGTADAQSPVGPAVVAPDSLVAFDGRRQGAERGSLVLPPEDPATAGGWSISWLRLPALHPTGRSPIVFLMGGPGIPATVIARVPPYYGLFTRLRDSADVILLDPRTVGLSTPNADCDPTFAPGPDLLQSRDALAQALVSVYAPCVAKWRARGVPAERIGVGEVAEDLDAVRAAVGAERLSILAFSHGTRLALEYARRHPERVDRLVLQGVLGFDQGARLPATLEALLDRVAEAVAGDSTGRSLAPDLRAALTRRFAALERAPLAVTAPGASGDTVRMMVGKEGFQALVTARLADPRLPALVASLERGDTRLLGMLAGGLLGDLRAGGGPLFGRAAYCSAPPSGCRLAEAARQGASSLLGQPFDNLPVSPDFCRAIGIEPGPEATLPAHLGGTALLIQGTLDDRTPLGNAEATAPLFREAVILTVRNGGHELLPAADVQEVVAGFLAGSPPAGATLTWPPPRHPGIAEAIAPPRRPGRP